MSRLEPSPTPAKKRFAESVRSSFSPCDIADVCESLESENPCGTAQSFPTPGTPASLYSSYGAAQTRPQSQKTIASNIPVSLNTTFRVAQTHQKTQKILASNKLAPMNTSHVAAQTCQQTQKTPASNTPAYINTSYGAAQKHPQTQKTPAPIVPASFYTSNGVAQKRLLTQKMPASDIPTAFYSSYGAAQTNLQTQKTPSSNLPSSKFRVTKAPFSTDTPYFHKETPLILATARHNGTGISTTCNPESIQSLQHSASRHLSMGKASEYFISRGRAPDPSISRATIPGPSGAVPQLSDSDVMDGEDIEPIRTSSRLEQSSRDSENQMFMGVIWHGGKLGMACYDVDSSTIYIMLDTHETDDFNMLQRVLCQVAPAQIVLSTKQDERLLKALRSYVSQANEESGIEEQSDMLQFLPSVDFSVEICKRRVLSIDLPSIPDHYTDTERTIYLSSLIPFENSNMIRAMGGLLKYLEKMRIGIELEEAGTKLPVLEVKIFSLETQLILDETAYSALQIFQRESHPSVYKSGTNNSGKEGLSLFGIMNRTKSQIGSKMLRTWFQRPLKNLQMICERHEAVAYFYNPRHIELVQTLEESVKHVKNISKILSRMMQSQASVGDWQALYKTVYNATCIKEVCKVHPQTIYIFRKVSEKFSDELYRISNYINRIVDFQESSLQGRFVVKPGVDAVLDRKRRIFSGLPDFMTKVAHEELQKLGDEVTECSVLYMPQIGHLLAIPESAILSQTGEGTDHEIEGLEFVFASNNILNYRSEGTKDLDYKLGDIRCDITDMETNVMHRLQNIILDHSGILVTVLDTAAELDCLLTLASCAREYGYVKPTMVKENTIQITAGRHPIQELCCSTYVPNDTMSGDEYGKIKVLTGPNACGKSVYLKQVALIVFLAQVGSFVPAQEARLGLIDRIYTRVRSLESVSIGLSTFMIDLNQMAEALRSADESSLCVVDEFGKGTDMIDGVSLLCSSLNYWLQRPTHCPHVLVSTHFHSIIHQQLLPQTPQIKYMTLETLHNGEELVFLYQLVEGHTPASYACHVAAQAGLPVEIIQRGIQASKLIQTNQPIQRTDTVDSDTRLKRCTKIVDRLLELDLDTADVKSFLSDFVLPTIDGNI